MDGKDFIAMVLVVFLSIWGALYLELGMSSYFVLELFVILSLIVISLGIFYSVASGKSWAWKALSAFFMISIVNSVLVYISAGNTTPFVLTLLVNIAGMTVAVSKKQGISARDDIPELPPMHITHINEGDLVDHIDVYEMQPEDFEPAQKKAAKKRKPGKSASKRRKK